LRAVRAGIRQLFVTAFAAAAALALVVIIETVSAGPVGDPVPPSVQGRAPEDTAMSTLAAEKITQG
jgi:hypothetical protein